MVAGVKRNLYPVSALAREVFNFPHNLYELGKAASSLTEAAAAAITAFYEPRRDNQ